MRQMGVVTTLAPANQTTRDSLDNIPNRGFVNRTAGTTNAIELPGARVAHPGRLASRRGIFGDHSVVSPLLYVSTGRYEFSGEELSTRQSPDGSTVTVVYSVTMVNAHGLFYNYGDECD